MRTEYKRDLDHSYMILQEISQIDTSSYQIRMLAANVIPKLLKCRIQGVDGKTMFSYEVTSKQPISALFEGKKLSIMDLQLIFGGFVQVMEDMAEFLLNPENLVIAPEHMYVDVEKKEVFFAGCTFIKGVLKEVFPEECALRAILGTGEPESTGQILAALAIGKGLFFRDWEVTGVFDEKRLDGTLRIAGRIRLIRLGWEALRLVMHRPVRKLIGELWKGRGERI